MITSTVARFVRFGLLPLALLGALLASCSSPFVSDSRVSSVTIQQDDFGQLVGEAFSLSAIVDVIGDASKDVAWSSNDPTIATVNATGEGTAVGVGTTRITATSVGDPTKTDSVTITVTASSEVVSVTIVADGDATVQVNSTLALDSEVVVTGDASQAIMWSSGDGTIASVDSTGVVTGLASGTVTITATSAENGAISDSVVVSVQGPPAITSFVATVGRGSTLDLTWTAIDADSFDVLAVRDGDAGDTLSLVSGLTGNEATVTIPASDRQTLRLVAHGAFEPDASTETMATNVVTRRDDYDPYDLQMGISAGRWPEPEVPGTLRSVLANAATGSVIGFASDIDLVTLDGVDVENIGTNIDAHLIFRDDVTISGPPSRVTVEGESGCPDCATVDEAFTWRSRMAFVMAGTTVMLENVQVTGGTFIFDGAGIRNDGDLTLENAVITGNRAWYKGGGIWNAASGVLRLAQGSDVTKNRAVTEDDEVGATFLIRGGSAVAVNANDGYGGGIWNEPGGVVVLTDTVVSGNEAKVSGGGFYIDGGSVDVTGSEIVDNQADHNAAGYLEDGLVSYGGGIYNAGALTLSDSVLSRNVAANQGGGLYHDLAAISDLDGVAIAENTAGTGPDAVSDAFGGGIMHHYYTGEYDNLQLSNIAFSLNTPQDIVHNEVSLTTLREGPRPGIHDRTQDDESGSR